MANAVCSRAFTRSTGGVLSFTPTTAVERTILNGLGDVLGCEFLGSRQIRDGAGNFQNAIVGAGAELQFVHGHLEQFQRMRQDTANRSPPRPNRDLSRLRPIHQCNAKDVENNKSNESLVVAIL